MRCVCVCVCACVPSPLPKPSMSEQFALTTWHKRKFPKCMVLLSGGEGGCLCGHSTSSDCEIKQSVLLSYALVRCANAQPFLCNRWGSFQVISGNFRQFSGNLFGPFSSNLFEPFSGNFWQFVWNPRKRPV